MPSCPWCDVVLVRVIGVSGQRHACPVCGGVAVAREVAERSFAAEVVAAVWQAGRAAEAGVRGCPFCAEPMRSAARGVSVCRTCEVLWLEAAATKRPLRAAEVPEPSTRCQTCGAPWVAGSDGTCRCCHRSAGAASVVFSDSFGERRPGAPNRFA